MDCVIALPCSCHRRLTFECVQTAERTKELAANTLGELQHQGQKLDMIDRDLHDVRPCLHFAPDMQPVICLYTMTPLL